MRDKFNTILFVVTFVTGILIIYLTPSGRNGYWIIPLIIYWTIQYFRKKRKG